MNIIWLCSWYPNKIDKFAGDFIQRQAIATSTYHTIDVLHIVFCDKKEKEIKNVNPQLREHIYYFRKRNWFVNLINYSKTHIRFLKEIKKTYHKKPDITHVQIPIKAGIVAYIYKILYKIPYVVTEHYGIYNTLLNNPFSTRGFWFKLCTKWVVKNADVLSTVSNSLGEDMNHWVCEKPFEIIPNVVDTSVFIFKQPSLQNKHRFIHISNMIPLKNVEGIIAASEILYNHRQDFEVILVGNNLKEYIDLAREKKMLDTIIFFKGVLAYEQIALEISDSHSLVIFSDTESQSCVVLEALCSGRPAIVSNVGGVKELIHEKNGFKVEPRNTYSLVDAMNMMMDNYYHFNFENISVDAKAKYTYDVVGKQFSEVYKRIIAEK